MQILVESDCVRLPLGGFLLRRNSVSGAVEATEWKSDAIALNEDLHKN